MKYIFTTVFLFILLSNSLLAQTEKGNFLIGAQSNMNFSSTDNELKSDSGDQDLGSRREFEIAPEIGYFLNDGFALGTAFAFTSSKYDNDNSENKVNSFVIKPFARYYFGKSNVKPYLHVGAGLGTMKSEFEQSSPYYGFYDGEDETEISLVEFRGGVSVFLNKKISIDMGVGYSSTKYKDKNSDDDVSNVVSGVGFKAGFSFFI